MLLCALPMLGQGAGYTQTRYPIVLVHGLFGFDKLLGSITSTASPGPDPGWRQGLRGPGLRHPELELRGEQLLKQVQQVLAITGRRR